ncbi:hypothetical protein C0J52_13024 [Blattella germanica]|nr:hypothetical protein C0J52_13024 [Blattella germanica]
MLMGIVQKPTFCFYFSKNATLATPVFGFVISMDRFEAIYRYLHFNNNNENINTYQGPCKLFKIFPIVQCLNNKFQYLYSASQNIAIGESLTLRRGRLSFWQYIPLKSSKFGIKTFGLCESSSGYLWSLIIYSGKDITFNPMFSILRHRPL